MSYINTRYKGDVNVKFKTGNKIYEVKRHNSGLPLLQKTFCMFLYGDREFIANIPKYVDLRFATSATAPDNEWQTCIRSKLALTAKQPSYDAQNKNWILTFNCALPHVALTHVVSESNFYRLYMEANNGAEANEDKDLAFIDVLGEDLKFIEPGTEAIIEWTMQLLKE